MIAVLTRFGMVSAASVTLPESRYLDFNDYTQTNAPNRVWVHEGSAPKGFGNYKALLPGTNHWHRSGWFFNSCRMGSAWYINESRSIPPKDPDSTPSSSVGYVAANLAANMQNTLGAYIESPIFTNGIGTIYFEAINSQASYTNQITVQIATNMYDSLLGYTNTVLLSTNATRDYVWETLEVIDLAAPTADDFIRYSRLLNYRSSAKFRILRTGTIHTVNYPLDDATTVIDNIRISFPPPDVAITKTEIPFEPGYPSTGTDIVIRCYVSDVDLNVPTTSRTVRVVYRWRYLNQTIGAWRTNALRYVSGTGTGTGASGVGNRYEESIGSFPESGDLEYHFVCDFGGSVYQSDDVTGSGTVGDISSASHDMGFPYRSESLSPRSLGGGAVGEFTTRIRPYKSRFGAFYAKTDQHDDPIPMELTGDNEWQAMVPVSVLGITNLTWQFQGTGEYVPNAEAAASGTNRWAGLSDVSGGKVPYGGICVPTDESGRLRVDISPGGAYAMLTLNTESLRYLANRAEYQNFNYWPAPLEIFSDSNGQIEKQCFGQTFNAWPTNTDVTYEESFVGARDYATTNIYYRGPFDTIGFWTAGSAALVQERPFDTHPDAVFGARNYALRLQGGNSSLGLGYVQDNVAHLPDGLRQITFNARLGLSADRNYVSYKRDRWTEQNYLVRATICAVNDLSVSPEIPSISLVGYFKDPDNFYEFRVSQIPDATDTAASFGDKCACYEIVKWSAGKAAVKAREYRTISLHPMTALATSSMEMRLYTAAGSSSTLIRCKFGSSDNVVTYSDTVEPYTFGTYGFMNAECRAYMAKVLIYKTTFDAAASAYVETPLSTTASISDITSAWYVPADRYEAKASGSGVTTSGIYSKMPSQSLGVYVQATTYGSSVEPNTTDWVLLGSVPITNFSYQPSVFTINSWQSKYVKLQVVGGDADVVVDSLFVHSWHGKTLPEGGLSYDWKATEAWAATNTTNVSTVVELNHSRANPTLDQAVRSPLLTNGLGVIEFDYRVNRAPAEIKVQYALQDSPNAWMDIDAIVVSNVVSWTHVAEYLGLSRGGYFRILNAREGGYTNAWVDVNDALVWDEPFVTNTSWKVYNAKITQTDTNHIYIDETKACFLNNSPTNETLPTQGFFLPSLMSPTLPKGLGTVSFLGRAYSSNQAATVYVYATANGWNAPTNRWFEIARFANITNMLYKPFSYTPVGGRKDINSIKLMSQNALEDVKGRVCLENVAVSEPVLPGFDIVNVTLMDLQNSDDNYVEYPQPLANDVVHVQARIANQQMSPSNIVMYVSYYAGTNVWGSDNWPVEETVTRRMHAVAGDPTLYRTRMDDGGVTGLDSALIGGITGEDSGAVVQYRVWATYLGGVPLTKTQETFDNPDWYYPVDLNKTHADQGWSPYYIVYDVPRNAVWINEINSYELQADGSSTEMYNNRYIEIAKPAWLDLAGWSIELVSGTEYTTHVISIPSGLPEHEADTNGYYFFVIANTLSTEGVPALPRKDLGYDMLNSYLPSSKPGGFRLKRPMGMYEQTIVYDRYADPAGSYSGLSWASNDPVGRFVYVGKDAEGGALARVGTTDSTNTWSFPQTWTPGGPNVGQQYPVGNGETLIQGSSNVWITSNMNLFKGTQNDRRLSSYSARIRKGSDTNITYRIDDWYRLYSVTMGGVEQMSAAESSDGQRLYTLALSNVQTSQTIVASVLLRKDLSAYVGTDILGWILGFPDGELVPSYYAKSTTGGSINWSGERELTMTELYWFNANPTQSNQFDFATTDFWVDRATSNLYINIKMALNETNSIAEFQGGAVLKLRAKGSLPDPEWSLVRQYSVNSASFGTNHTATVLVLNPFDALLPDVDPSNLFIRWKIEVSDPRVETETLINAAP